MVTCGDLSTEVLHAATGSLNFLSYTKTGIIIFTVYLPINYYSILFRDTPT